MSYKICVYAICKNESKFVNKWIESMKEADYIVVLDTGSTDNTVELLKNNPAVTRVESKIITPWRFDTARNESMKLIPEDTDICVCTDLDEIFEPGWANTLREIWKPELKQVTYKYVWSHDSNGNPDKIFTYNKIHCNKEHKWIYPVHEVCVNEKDEFGKMGIDAQYSVYSKDIILHHWQDLKKPRASYLDLLKMRFDENSKDPFSAYYLAREYKDHLYGADAMYYFKLCDTLFEEHGPEFKDIFCMHAPACIAIADEALKNNNRPEAKSYYIKAAKADPSNLEAYLKLARIVFDEKNYQLTIDLINEGLTNQRERTAGTDNKITVGYADFLLAACYFELKAVETADKHIKIALEKNPTQTAYIQLEKQIQARL